MKALGLAVAVLFLLSCSVSAAERYKVIDLGEGAVPLSINSRGQIVGMIYSPDGKSKAVLWEGRKVTDIGALLPYADCLIKDINESGQVLCQAYDASRDPYFYIYQDGKVTPVAGLRAASGIDDRGRVYGGTSVESQDRPAIWENGAVTPLPLVSTKAITSLAFDANSSGKIIGYTFVDAASHPTIWQGSTVSDLGAKGATSDGYPRKISGKGVTVGYTTVGSGGEGHSRAVMWDEQGKATLLGTLGGPSSVADDVNSSGQIVGCSQTAPSGTHAFIWQEGRMADLNSLAKTRYILERAYTISERGWIGCTGSDGRGREHGIVLMPQGR